MKPSVEDVALEILKIQLNKYIDIPSDKLLEETILKSYEVANKFLFPWMPNENQTH